MNYFHVYVIKFPSFYSAFSVLYIFIISFSISVLFSKRRISVSLIDVVKRFLNLLFEPDPYSNEHLVVNFVFDAAENESSKACQKVLRQFDRLS